MLPDRVRYLCTQDGCTSEYSVAMMPLVVPTFEDAPFATKFEVDVMLQALRLVSSQTVAGKLETSVGAVSRAANAMERKLKTYYESLGRRASPGEPLRDEDIRDVPMTERQRVVALMAKGLIDGDEAQRQLDAISQEEQQADEHSDRRRRTRSPRHARTRSA